MLRHPIHAPHGTRLLIVGLALSLGLSHAYAGPLATSNFALNDGFGPDAGRWHGTAAIVGAAFGDVVMAEVEWAAFKHGDFQLFLNSAGIAQVDPSASGEIVYVYQIASVTNAIPGIDSLTVGVDAGDGRGTISPPAFIPVGAANSKSPMSGGDNTTSMAWFFNGAELNPGDISDLLIFTSPFLPEFDFLQINSGLAGPVVSPLVASISNRRFGGVPEPASLALTLPVLFALRRRSRKS